MRSDAQAKYLNSPETPLFDKGRLLYNHHRARPAAHTAETVIAVEGYVDVIALAQVGITHVVAPLGTALTEDQLALLWRMAEEPILCFDGDGAGRRAADRAVGLALQAAGAGRSLRVALLPDGQDPDDLARTGGRAAIDAVLAGARPLVDMLWARDWEAVPTDTPERRAAAARRIRETVAAIRDDSLRLFYRDEIEARLRESRRGADTRSGASPGWRPADRRAPSASPTGYLGRPVTSVGPGLARFAAPVSGALAREALIVTVLAAHPDLLSAEAETLAALDLEDADARGVSDTLLDVALEGDPVESAVVDARLERAGRAASRERLTARIRPGDRWMLDAAADQLRLGDALRQAFTLQRRSRTLHSEKRAAERALADDASEATLSWLRDVTAELQCLDGTEAEHGST